MGLISKVFIISLNIMSLFFSSLMFAISFHICLTAKNRVILYRCMCRVDVSPTDVSPIENSWMLRPLNKVSLGYCAPDRCVPTLDRDKHETCSVGRYRSLSRPPAPIGSVGRLAGFAYAPDQVYWIGAPPSDARSAHT